MYFLSLECRGRLVIVGLMSFLSSGFVKDNGAFYFTIIFLVLPFFVRTMLIPRCIWSIRLPEVL